MLKLTIIVPVYKIEEELLRQCIESLSNQSVKNFEVILVDDGSPDNCGNICDEYAKKNLNFKVIHNQNKGVSNARNAGLKKAIGDYVMFLDADDYLELDTCERCLEVIDKYTVDLIAFKLKKSDKGLDGLKSTLINEKNDIVQIRRSIISHNEIFSGYLIGSPCMKLYKKSIIQNNGLRFVEGLKKCQDRVFNYDYFNYVKTLLLFDYEGYNYVANDNSVTNKYNNNIIEILDFAKSEFKKRLDINNVQDIHAYYSLCLRFFGEILHLDILKQENKDSFLKRSKRIKDLLRDKDYSNALKNGNIYKCGKKNSVLFVLIKLKLMFLAVIIGYYFNC